MNCLISLMRLHLLKIFLRPNSRPSLINLIKFSNNQRNTLWISLNISTNNKDILKKNLFLSTQKHCATKNPLKRPMKYQSSSHQGKFPYPLTRILNSLVRTAEPKQQNSNLNQNLKRLLMRSNVII